LSFVSQLGQQLVVQEIKQFLPSALTSALTNQTYVLSLGSVNFSVDDLPAEVKLGGTQALAIRQYPGGGLDVQSMGAFDDVISWNATFTYGGSADSSGIAAILAPTASTDSAITRALKLNAVRVQGQPVTLKIGTMSQPVVISKFSFSYANDYYVPYSIELQPTSKMSPQSKTTSTSLLNQSLQATVNSLLGNSSPIVKNALGQVLTKVTGAAANTSLGQILYNKAVGNSKLAVVGVALAVASQSVHTTGSGDSLFSIAKLVYGDGTLWPIIAKANGITNPIGIAIGQKLIIPSQTGA
jgi:LysM repeat protein